MLVPAQTIDSPGCHVSVEASSLTTAAEGSVLAEGSTSDASRTGSATDQVALSEAIQADLTQPAVVSAGTVPYSLSTSSGC